MREIILSCRSLRCAFIHSETCWLQLYSFRFAHKSLRTTLRHLSNTGLSATRSKILKAIKQKLKCRVSGKQSSGLRVPPEQSRISDGSPVFASDHFLHYQGVKINNKQRLQMGYKNWSVTERPQIRAAVGHVHQEPQKVLNKATSPLHLRVMSPLSVWHNL